MDMQEELFEAGCRRVWAAVLLQAFEDEAGTSSNASRKRKERLRDQQKAHRWIKSDSNKERSFNWVCNHLGLDSEVLREKRHRFLQPIEPKTLAASCAAYRRERGLTQLDVANKLGCDYMTISGIEAARGGKVRKGTRRIELALLTLTGSAA